MGGGDGLDIGDEDDDDRGASEEDLRLAWDNARETCRMLERDSRSPAPIVEAARRERDLAEAAWRAAKRPHPLHKRLRWAQRAYDAAVTKQQAHQEELEQFEEEMAGRRRFLLERARVDGERTARKLRALEEIMGQGELHPFASAQDAAQVAITGISEDLGPALAAAADKIPEDSPAWSEIQAAMAKLAMVEDVLRGASQRDERGSAQTPPPTVFDISGGPTEATPAEGDTRSRDVGPSAAVAPGGAATPATCASGARSPPASGRGAAAPPLPPKWTGNHAGSNRWGGTAWRRYERAEGGPGTVDRAPSERERAGSPIGDQRATLEAARASEREAEQAAQVQAAEAARMHQLQEEQRRRADIEAAAAAETLRRTRQAVAEAEAAEAARLEKERMALVARTSPEELRRAQEMHAQQSAIAAAGFGSALAAAGAQQLQAQGNHQPAAVDDTDRIMSMSPEELAAAQCDSMAQGHCPW